ncbi:hypothetical protein M9H77_35236 [Catharanthus roseus]|uniref:Uncharacterized protein n=1 Tax=Catharanthus roseus TaxID=4058 RepID=A0ACB9ZPP0_CATRO|nr:hypothetical protein M9H77_35236 [Catharanthus roseus]
MDLSKRIYKKAADLVGRTAKEKKKSLAAAAEDKRSCHAAAAQGNSQAAAAEDKQQLKQLKKKSAAEPAGTCTEIEAEKTAAEVADLLKKFWTLKSAEIGRSSCVAKLKEKQPQASRRKRP